jgi:hypothetical protein
MSKYRFLRDLFNPMTQELSGVNLCSDYEEEAVNSKGEHFLLCRAMYTQHGSPCGWSFDYSPLSFLLWFLWQGSFQFLLKFIIFGNMFYLA